MVESLSDAESEDGEPATGISDDSEPLVCPGDPAEREQEKKQSGRTAAASSETHVPEGIRRSVIIIVLISIL
jgi:hypothetical protein